MAWASWLLPHESGLWGGGHSLTPELGTCHCPPVPLRISAPGSHCGCHPASLPHGFSPSPALLGVPLLPDQLPMLRLLAAGGHLRERRGWRLMGPQERAPTAPVAASCSLARRAFSGGTPEPGKAESCCHSAPWEGFSSKRPSPGGQGWGPRAPKGLRTSSQGGEGARG